MPSVKHAKTSTIPDGADSTLVRPSDWNAEHVLVGDFGTASPPPDAASSDDYRDDGPPMPSPAVLSVVRELSGGKIVRDVRELVVDDNSLTDVGGNAVRLRGLSSGTIGCRVYGASNALTNATYVTLTWTSETFDTDNFHDPVTNTSRFTIPVGLAGKYLALAQVGATGATTTFDVAITKNGAAEADDPTTQAVSRTTTTSGNLNFPKNIVSHVLDLVAGDYIEVKVRSATGSLSAYDAWFSIVKLDSGRVGSGVGCRVRHSASQTIAGGAALVSAFDTTVWDTDGFHSTSVNNSRATVPTGMGGKYLVGASLNAAPVADVGDVYAEIYINATTFGGIHKMHAVASDDVYCTVSCVVALNAGDYVQLRIVNAISVNTRTINSNAGYSPELWLMRLDSLPQAHTDNLTATVAPTVSDDSTKGYTPGSIWIDNTADQSYVMADSGVGAAIWRQVPTKPNYKDYLVLNGATVNVPDADIGQVGMAFLTFSDGNNGGGMIQYYRAGTFNSVYGQMFGDGSFTAPRGSTFSAGTGFSIFLESNSAGARLSFKNSLGFQRTVRLWDWTSPLIAGGAGGLS